jgi:hypothetical protein
MLYNINDEQSLKDFNDCLNDGTIQIIKGEKNILSAKMNDEDCDFVFSDKYEQSMPAKIDDIINGIDKTDKVINIGVKDDTAYIYRLVNGETVLEKRPFKQFVLSPGRPNNTFYALKGTGHYRYRKYYTESDFKKALPKLYSGDFFFLKNPVEAFMMDRGITYYKGLNFKDIPILSFDLETIGFDPYKKEAKILCIGNTYRLGDLVIKKIFREDHYTSQVEMLQDWAKFVREVNPSIITGYNIYLFDIPYLLGIADKNNIDLKLGRDESRLAFEARKRPRTIRKDGSQSYDYRRPEAFGRDFVDMWVVTLKGDAVEKKYASYGVKHVIKVENLEKEGRAHYDPKKISIDWQDKVKRESFYQSPFLEFYKSVIIQNNHNPKDILSLFQIIVHLKKSSKMHYWK